MTFYAGDGRAVTSTSLDIIVPAQDGPPVLDDPGGRVLREGDTVRLQLRASDPDDDSVTFSAEGLPAGATLHPLTGAFAWTAAYDQAGTYQVTFTATAHAWVLVPAMNALFPSDPVRFDIASELYGWPTVIEAVKEQMVTTATPYDPEGREVVVVGPHWTICAQLHAGLPGIHVGCATPIPDDFDRWSARDDWRRADHVLFVTDARFPGDGAEQLPAHVPTSHRRVRVLRGGRTARIFDLYLYAHRQSAAR